jgi:hypothetical protein
MPIIHGDYDYDVHSIEVDNATLTRIKDGNFVTIDGQGFLNDEAGELVDHWCFNADGDKNYFWLDNGSEFYCKRIWFD